MKQFKSLRLILLFLLASLSSLAQLELGEATFSYAKAKPLLRSESIFSAIKTMSYLSEVGGVAFDKQAMPDGIQINEFRLKYNPTAEDGRRFSVIINGHEAQSFIYDWELVPIAKYANSVHNACFTLFGQLEDEKETKMIGKEGGRILNYHPELSNTLLGLRLFELDILIIEPELSTDLPKAGGSYLLGRGEKNPDIDANKVAYNKFRAHYEKSLENITSYVICDLNQSIRFGVQNNSLYITGQPFYYFWRYNTGSKAFRDSVAEVMIYEQASAMKSGSTQTEKSSLLENWLLNEIYKELSIFYKDDYASERIRLAKELSDIRTKEGNEKYMEELELSLLHLRISNAPKFLVYLSTLSNAVSGQSQLLRGINPAVWDAGVTTMRYAAFFRYCKDKFPQEWNQFMSQIKQIAIQPNIKTPSVMTFK